MPTCCQRCGDAIFERDGLMLVTIAPPSGRGVRRLVVCRECAERLIRYLAARP